MDSRVSTAILVKVRAAREKQADGPAVDPQAFADAMQAMNSDQLRTDALKDVSGLGALGFGVAAGARGLVGLLQSLRRNRQRKLRSGPAVFPLPFPVKTADWRSFFTGSQAGSKTGIPWYQPAMMTAGLAGLAGGWKGIDSILEARRKQEREDELDKARHEFHDALLSQYDAPLPQRSPALLRQKAAGEPSVMEKVGRELDATYAAFQAALAAREKRGLDWQDLTGKALGGYGVYAGLTGLLSGALVYDQARKRSRRSVIETALKRRQMRNFTQAPTEIFAVPEPVTRLPGMKPKDELALMAEAPEE